MYKFLRFFLFKIDPERVHYFVSKMLHLVVNTPLIGWCWKKSFVFEDPKLEREVFGIKFKNPIGLAAGFDKNAMLFEDLKYCGFGFIEIGTVTPKCQEGNPKKRLFRLRADHGLINRMGFNNEGVKAAADLLSKRNHDIIIGGNIGKNKVTPNEDAITDYIICLNTLYEHVDYFVVNVSSPNTPGLRDLQTKIFLKELFTQLFTEREKRSVTKPILLKIAPDLSNEQLDEIIDLMLEMKIDGIIATNTTISRANLNTLPEFVEEIGNGGLSGKPLKSRSTEVIRYIAEKSNHAFPIIGVGGIASPEDAIEKLKAGATLLQLYTGYIYEGPGLMKRINKRILSEIKS